MSSNLPDAVSTEHRPLITEHSALAPLMPYAQAALQKGLRAVRGEDEAIHPIETYAHSVFDRACELDNAIASLELAMEYLKRLGIEDDRCVALYRYHHENFVFRLTGLTDRAYRLVGASLNLNVKRFESARGNKYVAESLGLWPEIAGALGGIDAATAKYKPTRNKIAHAESYSDRFLSLFDGLALPSVKLGNDEAVLQLKRIHFPLAIEETSLDLDMAVQSVGTLLDTLAPRYRLAIEDPAQVK